MRECPKCRTTKADGQFRISDRTGCLIGWCRECRRRYNREMRAAQRARDPEQARVAARRENERRKFRPKVPPPATKRCPGCGEIKPAVDFGFDQRTRTGLRPRCRKCVSAEAMKWNREHPERFKRNQRKARLKAFYGITPERFDELLAEQGGVCAICGQLPYGKGLHVDHCHRTGTVRGLLCFRCNTMLGHLGDDPALLHRAVEYLAAAERQLQG